LSGPDLYKGIERAIASTKSGLGPRQRAASFAMVPANGNTRECSEERQVALRHEPNFGDRISGPVTLSRKISVRVSELDPERWRHHKDGAPIDPNPWWATNKGEKVRG